MRIFEIKFQLRYIPLVFIPLLQNGYIWAMLIQNYTETSLKMEKIAFETLLQKANSCGNLKKN